MSQTVDRRIARTKRMLREALMDLIEERGIEGITVRDLTEKAGLNRGTFYLHYRDIHHLLESSKIEMLQGLNQKAGKDSFPEKLQTESPDFENSLPCKLFEYFAENHRFFEIMLGPKGDPSYIYELKRFMKEHVNEKHERLQFNEQNMLVPKDYLIAYMISATIGMIQHWFESGMNKTPCEMARIVYHLAELGPIRASGMMHDPKREQGQG